MSPIDTVDLKNQQPKSSKNGTWPPLLDLQRTFFVHEDTFDYIEFPFFKKAFREIFFSDSVQLKNEQNIIHRIHDLFTNNGTVENANTE